MKANFEKILKVISRADVEDRTCVNCIVYHYTSPEGFLGILQPGGFAKLWFTRYDSLNDTSERRDILVSLESYCTSKIRKGTLSKEFCDEVLGKALSDDELITYPGKQPVLAETERRMGGWIRAKSVACDTYLCCFSLSGDLLPMWNYYTKSQHYEGYSIGISSNHLQGGIDGNGYCLEMRRVIYRDEEKRRLFDQMLLPLNKLFINGTEEERRDIITVVGGKLNEFQFVFKNECFQHEQEIRAILRIPRDEVLPGGKKFDVKYRANKGYIVPYVEYEFPAAGIEEVTIAPLLQKEISENNVSQMLEQRGYLDVIVNASEVPIRF